MAKRKLPQEIQEIVQNTLDAIESTTSLEQEVELLQQEVQSRKNSLEIWDVPEDVKIEVFDPTLSYELTGYKPINETKGLDFKPEWFTEARDTYMRTGHYCQYLRNSKRYNDFWLEEYKRCKYGHTSHGYTITGDNYFFLNYYVLPLVDDSKASGAGLDEGFPKFMVSQYIFFHYLEMARHLHKHAAMMKARSIGFSEINASLSARMYSVIERSRTIITCYDDKKLDNTWSKFDHALNFLQTSTDGGFFKLRLTDKKNFIKAGHQIKKDGQFVDAGWIANVEGINGSKPSNIRGPRCQLIIFDEAGSWPGIKTAITQGQELCEVQGVPMGTMLFGGTGGDFGAPLEGLRDIYYNPRAFKVLPYRHSYTSDGTQIDSGFFVPYFLQSLREGMMDERGYPYIDKIKAELLEERENLRALPQTYAEKCAERCWNAEEAFALEGDNKFNKAALAEQMAKIRLHKIGPRPEKGRLSYIFKGSKPNLDEVVGFNWVHDENSKLQILEHPIWTDEYFKQAKKQREKDLANGMTFEDEVTKYEPMKDLYIAGVDGIDIGKSQTSKETREPSDFCIVIKKRAMGTQEPTIVAMYKDRPNEVTTAYKIALTLIKYYNAKVNVEATRVGFLNWAKTAKQLRYFMQRPQATLANIKSGSTQAYGTPATGAIIEMQTDLIATYIEDYSHTIWFEEIIDELQRYNDDNKTKFDIVAALGMVELADQELSHRVPTKVVSDTASFQDFGYWTDDKGYKHFGVIPKKEKQQILYAEHREDREAYDPYRIDITNPRYHM